SKQKFYHDTGRVFRLIKKGKMLDKQDSLDEKTRKVVEEVYRKIKLTPVEFGMKEKNGLKVLWIDKLINKKPEDSPDIINVYGELKSGFRRPNKVSWRKILDDKPAIEQINSKRARKQIIGDTNKLSKLGIEIKIIKDIQEQVFQEWLLLYKKIISAKERGDVLLNEKYLKDKKELGKITSGIFAYQNGKMVGGELFSDKNGILGIGYGIAERFDELNGGLTLLMDFEFIKYAQENGYKEISFGQDTNLYGHDLSIGLITYKAKLGFTPKLANKAYWFNTFFVNTEKF